MKIAEFAKKALLHQKPPQLDLYCLSSSHRSVILKQNIFLNFADIYFVVCFFLCCNGLDSHLNSIVKMLCISRQILKS